MLNYYIELRRGARLIRTERPAAKNCHISFLNIQLRLGAGTIGASVTTATVSSHWAVGWRQARFDAFTAHGDDTIRASPLKADGESMQPKLRSDTAQFAAELTE
jgi:hypothetical protein